MKLIIVYRCDSQLCNVLRVLFNLLRVYNSKHLLDKYRQTNHCQSEKQNPGNDVWHFVALETGFSCRYYSAHKRGTEGAT